MKPKIPKLTKKERREWIKALREVLNNYRNKNRDSDCPFCLISKSGGCSDCVWIWLTGLCCVDYVDIIKDLWQRDFWMNNLRWGRLRIEQIPRWIKKLEEGL